MAGLTRSATGTLTAAILKRVKNAPWMPRFRTGTISTTGDTPTVILAGDTDPIPANSLGDPGAEGETVWAVQFLNTCLIIGRAGGTRLYGYATGPSDDAFTSVEVLDTLTVDIVVTQPNRVLWCYAQGLFSVGTNGASVIVRIRADGVNIGRVGTHTFPTASVGETLSGGCLLVAPDPGGITIDVTGEASGGTGTYAGATSTGYLQVVDWGPAA